MKSNKESAEKPGKLSRFHPDRWWNKKKNAAKDIDTAEEKTEVKSAVKMVDENSSANADAEKGECQHERRRSSVMVPIPVLGDRREKDVDAADDMSDVESAVKMVDENSSANADAEEEECQHERRSSSVMVPIPVLGDRQEKDVDAAEDETDVESAVKMVDENSSANADAEEEECQHERRSSSVMVPIPVLGDRREKDVDAADDMSDVESAVKMVDENSSANTDAEEEECQHERRRSSVMVPIPVLGDRQEKDVDAAEDETDVESAVKMVDENSSANADAKSEECQHERRRSSVMVPIPVLGDRRENDVDAADDMSDVESAVKMVDENSSANADAKSEECQHERRRSSVMVPIPVLGDRREKDVDAADDVSDVESAVKMVDENSSANADAEEEECQHERRRSSVMVPIPVLGDRREKDVDAADDVSDVESAVKMVDENSSANADAEEEECQHERRRSSVMVPIPVLGDRREKDADAEDDVSDVESAVKMVDENSSANADAEEEECQHKRRRSSVMVPIPVLCDRREKDVDAADDVSDVESAVKMVDENSSANADAEGEECQHERRRSSVMVPIPVLGDRREKDVDAADDVSDVESAVKMVDENSSANADAEGEECQHERRRSSVMVPIPVLGDRREKDVDAADDVSDVESAVKMVDENSSANADAEEEECQHERRRSSVMVPIPVLGDRREKDVDAADDVSDVESAVKMVDENSSANADAEGEECQHERRRSSVMVPIPVLGDRREKDVDAADDVSDVESAVKMVDENSSANADAEGEECQHERRRSSVMVPIPVLGDRQEKDVDAADDVSDVESAVKMVDENSSANADAEGEECQHERRRSSVMVPIPVLGDRREKDHERRRSSVMVPIPVLGDRQEKDVDAAEDETDVESAVKMVDENSSANADAEGEECQHERSRSSVMVPIPVLGDRREKDVDAADDVSDVESAVKMVDENSSANADAEEEECQHERRRSSVMVPIPVLGDRREKDVDAADDVSDVESAVKMVDENSSANADAEGEECQHERRRSSVMVPIPVLGDRQEKDVDAADDVSDVESAVKMVDENSSANADAEGEECQHERRRSSVMVPILVLGDRREKDHERRRSSVMVPIPVLGDRQEKDVDAAEDETDVESAVKMVDENSSANADAEGEECQHERSRSSVMVPIPVLGDRREKDHERRRSSVMVPIPVLGDRREKDVDAADDVSDVESAVNIGNVTSLAVSSERSRSPHIWFRSPCARRSDVTCKRHNFLGTVGDGNLNGFPRISDERQMLSTSDAGSHLSRLPCPSNLPTSLSMKNWLRQKVSESWMYKQLKSLSPQRYRKRDIGYGERRRLSSGS
ncbi:hypothetical protein AAHC03_01895 [Spirometra sp. Aus1]